VGECGSFALISGEDAIANADFVAASAITAWETAILRNRRRIEIDRAVLLWLSDLSATQGLRILPITIEISVLAAEFHDTLRDPIDCLIAATALTHNAPLVTKDDRIRKSGVVETIW
jgi:PIN domain nuclease of toxin-antitoxin system